MPRLTKKQATFVAEYLVDLNATQAAIRAGYSEKNAAKIAYQLLDKTRVREAIQKAQNERAKRTQITADRVVDELAKIAFSDPRDLMEWGPNGVVLKDSSSLTEEQAASVAEISMGKDGTIRLKKHDKVKALELLGKHTGAWTEKLQAELSGGLNIQWEE